MQRVHGPMSCDAFVVDSILWDNRGGEIVNSASTPIVAFSDVRGGYPGRGNIDADPMCVDPEHGDFQLRPGSPCIDSGANNAIPADTRDLDGDGDTRERSPVDVLGYPRFADDPASPDVGCGAVAIVDMGVCEFVGTPLHPVLIGDVDGDGVVGFLDLLDVLSSYGPCVPDCCVADVDFSSEVNFGDVLLVLSNWR